MTELVMPLRGAALGSFLALAPMDGVTDAVTRALLTDYNAGPTGVDLCISEFVRVTQLPAVPKVLLRHVPELRGDGCTPSGVPVFVQLLGGDPEPLAETARRAVAMGARGIDLNFGCPAKTVNRHDGGATLLKYPERLRGITAAVREALQDRVPLSVKIRTGWDSPDGVAQLAQAAEAGGAAFLTIHGRTRMDMYKPPANWRAIHRAQEAVGIPVVANGDLLDPASAARCVEQSGCGALMVGRGAMAQPNLFMQLRSGAAPALESAYLDFLRTYAERLLEDEVAESRIIGKLKNWVALGAAVQPGLKPLFDGFKRAGSLSQVAEALWRGRPAGDDQAA